MRRVATRMRCTPRCRAARGGSPLQQRGDLRQQVAAQVLDRRRLALDAGAAAARAGRAPGTPSAGRRSVARLRRAVDVRRARSGARRRRRAARSRPPRTCARRGCPRARPRCRGRSRRPVLLRGHPHGPAQGVQLGDRLQWAPAHEGGDQPGAAPPESRSRPLPIRARGGRRRPGASAATGRGRPRSGGGVSRHSAPGGAPGCRNRSPAGAWAWSPPAAAAARSCRRPRACAHVPAFPSRQLSSLVAARGRGGYTTHATQRRDLTIPRSRGVHQT